MIFQAVIMFAGLLGVVAMTGDIQIKLKENKSKVTSNI